jgi:hypothetical protein
MKKDYPEHMPNDNDKELVLDKIVRVLWDPKGGTTTLRIL